MKDFRFKLGVLSSVFYVLLRALPRANKIIEQGEKASWEERFTMASEIVTYMRRHFATTTYVFGTENIPAGDGFVTMGNHQGKYDALGIYEAMGHQTSVLWEKRQASRILSRQICGLIDAVQIDLKDSRDIVRAIHRCTDIVADGRTMIIFPEGGYDENHNELQNFNTGCFQVCLRTKAPILPVALFDTYRSMNTNHLGRVRTQIHFLPVIPWEEYGGMKKQEIAELLKSRIDEKLTELKALQDPYDIIASADRVLYA